mmetsp:Transcript_14108/g.45144  ORF Transcript_14108/g.45144 Transcript_14108/m.45144 type:complete len:208 (+) Transcript_14108:83-706(+)
MRAACNNRLRLVPHRSVCTSSVPPQSLQQRPALGVPHAHSPVLGARQHQIPRPKGTPHKVASRVLVATQFLQWAPHPNVPHPVTVVFGGTQKLGPTRRDGDRSDLPKMLRQRADTHAAERIPKLDGAVFASAHQQVPVRVEHCLRHGRIVPLKRPQRLRPCHVPQAHCPVVPPRAHVRLPRVPRHRVHVARMPHQPTHAALACVQVE